MKEKIHHILNKVLDFLVPPNIKCIYCGEEIETPNKYNACKNCLKTLPYNNKKVCKFCGDKISDESTLCLSCFFSPPLFKIARAPFLYEPPISTLISNLKFENAKYAVKPLAQFLIDEYIKNNYECDIVIPVPLSPLRQKQRKFNQASLIASIVAKHFNLPMIENAVVRSRNTPKQTNLDYRARQQNMIDAFELVSKSNLKDKNILVIDDVYTTGATIHNFCKTLKKAKPKNIYVLTIAHTHINRAKIKRHKFTNQIKYKIKILTKKIKLKLKK